MSSAPSIAEAKQLCYRHRLTECIILHFAYDPGADSTKYGVTSYGMTRERCARAKETADRLFDIVANPEAWAKRYLAAKGYTVTR